MQCRLKQAVTRLSQFSIISPCMNLYVLAWRARLTLTAFCRYVLPCLHDAAHELTDARLLHQCLRLWSCGQALNPDAWLQICDNVAATGLGDPRGGQVLLAYKLREQERAVRENSLVHSGMRFRFRAAADCAISARACPMPKPNRTAHAQSISASRLRPARLQPPRASLSGRVSRVRATHRHHEASRLEQQDRAGFGRVHASHTAVINVDGHRQEGCAGPAACMRPNTAPGNLAGAHWPLLTGHGCCFWPPPVRMCKALDRQLTLTTCPA
jgi:hypothetical protein